MKDIFKKRNIQVVRALKANKKKAKMKMRRENGGRCCLCVAEDAAIENGLNISKCGLFTLVPHQKTQQYLGWEDTNPYLILLKGYDKRRASWINDSPLNIPHKIIAEYYANTFTRKRFRLSKKARYFAERLVGLKKKS